MYSVMMGSSENKNVPVLKGVNDVPLTNAVIALKRVVGAVSQPVISVTTSVKVNGVGVRISVMDG